MTWSTANKTWSVGEVVTAAMLNTYLRDQFDQTSLARVNAAGDMVYASNANTLTRLGIGSTGQLLAVQGGGLPAWFTPPHAKVRHSSTQTLANATVVRSLFDTEIYDPQGMHSTASNSSRLLPTVPGIYYVTGNVYVEASSAGYVEAYLETNAAPFQYERRPRTPTSEISLFSVAGEYAFSTGDAITLAVAQNSGGSLALIAGGVYAPTLSAHWVSPI